MNSLISPLSKRPSQTSDEHSVEPSASLSRARPPRVIFVNRFGPPDLSATSQMLTSTACDLAALGRSVLIVTSRQRYDEPDARLAPREVIDGVDIIRIPTTHFGRDWLVGRAADYVSFYVSATFAILRHARAGDVVVAKTDPPMLSIALAPVARLKRAYLVNWLQDLFPEVAQELSSRNPGTLARQAFRMLTWLRNRSLRATTMNVAISPMMAARLHTLGVARDRICVISNFANGRRIVPVRREFNALRRDWGLAHDFVVAYSGNLGRAHDEQTILGAIKALEARRSERMTEHPHATPPRISWLFVGGGARFSKLRAEVERLQLKSVVFKPYQPPERLAESLSVADVHLITLKPALEGLILPSKLYGICAAGRPAIFIGDRLGEVASFLQRADCGLSVDEGDGDGLARAIMTLAQDPARTVAMGLRARGAFDAEFEQAIATGAWNDLIQRVLASSPRHPARQDQTL